MIEEEKSITPEIKNALVNKFHVEASPGFTEKVMLEVKAAQSARNFYIKVFMIVIISFVSLALIVFTGDVHRIDIISFNANPIFRNIQKLIFMLKPEFAPFIIFSISTTIFLDLLMKRLMNKKIDD